MKPARSRQQTELVLFISPESADDMFAQNVGWNLANSTALYSIKRNSSNIAFYPIVLY
jgi:hypothetical protein